MRRIFTLVVSAFLLLLCQSTSLAQRYYSDVTRVAGEVENKVKKNMPEWKHKAFRPMSFDETDSNDKVVIQQWILGSQVVKVSILQHASAEEATESIRHFVSTKRIVALLQNAGDEAYVYGLRGSIALRRGNVVVYIGSVVSMQSTEADAGVKSKEERKQEKLISKKFADQILDALVVP